MNEFFSNAKRGAQSGADFKMTGTFRQGAGTTQVTVEKKATVATRAVASGTVIVITIGVVIIALASFGR